MNKNDDENNNNESLNNEKNNNKFLNDLSSVYISSQNRKKKDHVTINKKELFTVIKNKFGH